MCEWMGEGDFWENWILLVRFFGENYGFDSMDVRMIGLKDLLMIFEV